MNDVVQDEINFDDFIEIDPNEARVDQDDDLSEQLEQMAEDNDLHVDQIELSLLNKEQTQDNEHNDIDLENPVTDSHAHLNVLKKTDEPRKLVITSSEAQSMLENLENARMNKDGEELSNLVFDAECEDMQDQIDLYWYETYAAQLMESNSQ